MKIFWRLVVVLVVIGLFGGVLYYERPEWVARQGTHLGLFLSRVQSNYVMTPEGRVHYYEGEPRIPGGGVPLVLVHGLADRDESWAPMLRRLKAAGFHVYALDLLGAGAMRPEEGTTPAVLWLLSDRAKWVHGTIQVIDGGLNAKVHLTGAGNEAGG